MSGELCINCSKVAVVAQRFVLSALSADYMPPPGHYCTGRNVPWSCECDVRNLCTVQQVGYKLSSYICTFSVSVAVVKKCNSKLFRRIRSPQILL